MAVSRRLRYEILRRDNHQCRYCGATAPEAKLTVDHVVPRALGGSDDPSNLVAACKDCNAGKSSASPDQALLDDVRTDSELWKRAKAAAAEGRKANKYVGFVSEIASFDEAWLGWTYESAGKRHHIDRRPDWKVSVRVWLLRGLPIERLIELVPVAMKRSGLDHDDRWRYFCGCAWRAVEDWERDTEHHYAAAKERRASERADDDRAALVGPFLANLVARLGDVLSAPEIAAVGLRVLELIEPFAKDMVTHGLIDDGEAALFDALRDATVRHPLADGEDYVLTLARGFFADVGLDPDDFLPIDAAVADGKWR